MITNNQLHLIGVASGLAGADIHSGEGPLIIQKSSYLPPSELYTWDTIIRPPATLDTDLYNVVADISKHLAEIIVTSMHEKRQFCVVAGDHTSAIGTWSGVAESMREQGDIGLIWIDAHMDSHTPETSESGRIHGMPLASLLGYGDVRLASVLHPAPKLKPQNVCLIGVRSYEAGEAEFLKRSNVRVYFMEEVLERGLPVVMQEAAAHVSKHTVGYGISLDIDVIDPIEAPGVDVPEANGLSAVELAQCLEKLVADPKLLATEVVEFDPTRDREQKTEKIVADIIQLFARRGQKLAK